MKYYPEFARLLNEHLNQTDRNPSWLARRLEVSPATVTRWLNNATRPGQSETVLQIASILGIVDEAQRQELLVAAGYTHSAKVTGGAQIPELKQNLENIGQQVARIGTTPFIFLSQKPEPAAVKPGENYFLVKVKGIQAAYLGSVWDQLKQLLIVSRTGISNPAILPEPVEIIQDERDVKPGQVERLSLSPTLVDLVPATMTNVTIAIVFKDGQRSRSILHFAGDFNILVSEAGINLREGSYVALGTQDERNPLPTPEQLGILVVQDNGELWMDGKPVTHLSYIIMQVRCLEVRTRHYWNAKESTWNLKLHEAEAIAQDVGNHFLDRGETKEQAWQRCLQLLKEARTLLYADPHYLPREVDDIYKEVAVSCLEQIFAGERTQRLRNHRGIISVTPETVRKDLTELDIDPEEDLKATLTRYTLQVARARRILRQEGLGK